MVKTYSQLYLDSRKALLQTEDGQSAGFIARNLLCHVSGKTYEEILAHSQVYASQEVCDGMDAFVKRVLTGEPLAYILGQWEFYGLPMFVNRDVLIPRDDTCAVVDLVLKYADVTCPNLRILDLCTGTGCIGLAIASRLTRAKVTLADISKDVLSVAKRNITANQLSARVSSIQADALDAPSPFLGIFDFIVSNPPYITAQEMKQLPHSVADYEPHLALFGGEDGLHFYRNIIENYTQILKPGGFLAFEFGMGQGDSVCNLLEKKGYTILERSSDNNEIERAVIAQYSRKDH